MSAGDAAIALPANRASDRRADGIPHRLAASRVDLADEVTAVLVVAVGAVVGEAAVARFGCAAKWIRADLLASRIDARDRGAESIPRAGAAEDIDKADRVAAGLIIAPRSRVWFAAVFSAGVAALVLVALTVDRCVDQLHAAGIPLGGAAEVVDDADGLAALRIGAGRLGVRDVASVAAVVAALGKEVRAGLAGLDGAVFVPRNDAAVFELRRSADLLTAVANRAAWDLVGVEAVAAGGLTAATEAGLARREDAGGIPANFAAEGLKAADRFAARWIVAVGCGVRTQTLARAAVAATWRTTADDARDGRAACIPTLRAAEWIHIADA